MNQISQKLSEKQIALAAVDRTVAAELSKIHGAHGGKAISQQTYHAWKKGRVPTDSYTTTLSRWLDLPVEEIAAMLAADRAAGGPSRIQSFTSLAYVAERGKIADRKEGKYRFAGTRPVPEGRYVMQVDTKVMEPIFHVGTQIWLDPAPMARPGNEVIVHSGGFGWLGVLHEWNGTTAKINRPAAGPLEIKGVDAIHVVILSSRV